MDRELLNYIDQAIALEVNTANLYRLFAKKCPQDREFWFRLEVEEMNHAALLRAGKEFAVFNKFPAGLLPENIRQLADTNQLIIDGMDKFMKNPERAYCFELAIELENEAGELHYQQFMESESQEELATLFKKLNRDDYQHAERIKTYRQDVLRI
jgi:ferritin